MTALTHLGIDIDPAWELDGQVVGSRAVPGRLRRRTPSGMTSAPDHLLVLELR